MGFSVIAIEKKERLRRKSKPQFAMPQRNRLLFYDEIREFGQWTCKAIALTKCSTMAEVRWWLNPETMRHG